LVNNNNNKKKDIGLNVLFRTFHDNFQVNLYPPKNIFVYFFLNIRWIYASVFNIFKFELNPLVNKKKKNVLFRTFSGHFMTIFRSNYFHLKLSFFKFCLNIRYIYANVFKIFKFELNPLDNKKDIGLYVLFRTFSGHFMTIFRSNYFHLKNVFLVLFFNIR
jgi:hypothetical protein